MTSISHNVGASIGGNKVTITGTGFVDGATVTIGGNAATVVTFVSSTSLTAVAPASTGFATGAVNVVVTNPDTQSGTLTNGYTYVTLEFIHHSVYSGQPDSYWKYTWQLQENVTDAKSYGGLSDKMACNIYSDAACTTSLKPQRVASGTTIRILSPGYLWMGVEDRLFRKRTNDAEAQILVWITVTNTLYYRDYTPGTFGAPLTLGESWTYTEENVSSQSLGNYVRTGTATVAAATEDVTVTAGTFTCYKITYSINSKTFTEWWDASGAFPYFPVKIVDSYNFANTQTNQMYSSNVLP